MDLDSATIVRLRMVYPDLAVRIIRVYEDMDRLHGQKMKCTEGLRSWKYQADLYAKGRTEPGKIVTYSKPGDSLHHYGCAVDSCFQGEDPYREKHRDGEFHWAEFGRLCKAYGLKWGGDFKFVDKPHAELTYGISLTDIKELYQVNKTASIWAKFDQVRQVQEGSEWNSLSSKTVLFDLGLIPDPKIHGGIES